MLASLYLLCRLVYSALFYYKQLLRCHNSGPALEISVFRCHCEPAASFPFRSQTTNDIQPPGIYDRYPSRLQDLVNSIIQNRKYVKLYLIQEIRKVSICRTNLSRSGILFADASPWSSFSFSWARDVSWYFWNMKFQDSTLLSCFIP